MQNQNNVTTFSIYAIDAFNSFMQIVFRAQGTVHPDTIKALNFQATVTPNEYVFDATEHHNYCVVIYNVQQQLEAAQINYTTSLNVYDV